MKVAALISGGVDSSVALKLLKDQGYEVEAFYLKIWLEDELSHLADCPWEEDLKYAKAVCRSLNVQLHTLNFQKEYNQKIVTYTVNESKSGRTPSPDILCNKQIKFGLFLEKVGVSFDKVASGHYAQILQNGNKYILKRSPDQIKDQTYFLSSINQDQLSKLIFPIGHLTKKEVRELAEKFDLPNKNRKDSQGICFLGKFKFKEFLKAHLGTKNGNLVEFETGKLLGAHEGHWFYTIGQRHGIFLPDGPWYVVNKDPEKNVVHISKNYSELEEPRTSFVLSNLHWIEGKPPYADRLLVKLRHKATPTFCKIEWLGEDKVKVTLEKKDQGIAPGQFAVFYEGDNCQGSGIIE